MAERKREREIEGGRSKRGTGRREAVARLPVAEPLKTDPLAPREKSKVGGRGRPAPFIATGF